MAKTNAMRILDKEKIDYTVFSYDVKDDLIDGISVAHKIGRDTKEVYKTLVGHGKEQTYVFIIPVDKELDLKKASEVANEKKVELVHVKDLQKLTGYIRGGCSPIGMKKLYPSFIQQDALELDDMIVSGGKIGLQIKIAPKDLAEQIQGNFADIIK